MLSGKAFTLSPTQINSTVSLRSMLKQNFTFIYSYSYSYNYRHSNSYRCSYSYSRSSFQCRRQFAVASQSFRSSCPSAILRSSHSQPIGNRSFVLTSCRSLTRALSSCANGIRITRIVHSTRPTANGRPFRKTSQPSHCVIICLPMIKIKFNVLTKAGTL